MVKKKTVFSKRLPKEGAAEGEALRQQQLALIAPPDSRAADARTKVGAAENINTIQLNVNHVNNAARDVNANHQAMADMLDVQDCDIDAAQDDDDDLYKLGIHLQI